MFDSEKAMGTDSWINLMDICANYGANYGSFMENCFVMKLIHYNQIAILIIYGSREFNKQLSFEEVERCTLHVFVIASAHALFAISTHA